MTERWRAVVQVRNIVVCSGAQVWAFPSWHCFSAGAQIALIKHDDGVGLAAFNPANDRVVTALYDKTARLRNGRWAPRS